MPSLTQTLTRAATVLALLGATTAASAQINLDFAGATPLKDANANVRISNIGYQGALYDVTLQWNPYDTRFDIASVVLVSGSARVCSLGDVNFFSLVGPQDLKTSVSLVADPVAHTILVRMTPKALYTEGWDFFQDFSFRDPWTLVQGGREMTTNTASTALNATMAPVAKTSDSVDLSWRTIPAGSERRVLISSVPTYINLSLPLTKVVINRKEFACK